MGRPPTPLGTYGKIRTFQRNGIWRARTIYRDYDGVSREVQRHGKSENTARRALAEALRDRARFDSGSDIRPETRVDALAAAWFRSLEGKDRSITTLTQYRYRLDHQVIPGLGALRVMELTTSAIDRHLTAVAHKHGAATARMVRSVVSGMCSLAVRHDAIERNPVREASPISTKPKNPPRALTEAQALQLRAMLTYDTKAIARDLPAFVATMLASGLRVGEASALTWDSIDFQAGTAEVRGTVIREKGKGLRIKPAPKTAAGIRTLKLPDWCVELLRARAVSRFAHPDDPVFPAPLGGLRDPSNTAADLKEAFTAAGFGWASSHTLRKTTATLLDRGGLTAREIADQLGHANPSMTQDRYLGRAVASKASAVLEALD